MIEMRCEKCHKLLCKMSEGAVVSIKCPRCSTLNTAREGVNRTTEERTSLKNAHRMFREEL